MNRFHLTLSYTLDGKNYISHKRANEHYRIQVQAYTNHIRLELESEKVLTNLHFSVGVPYDFQEDQRLFLNGFQSWSRCMEHEITDKPDSPDPYLDLFPADFCVKAYGDYGFHRIDRTPGIFHGYSYGYIRQGEHTELFASLNERTGYTIFTFAVPLGQILVEKDLDGVTCSGRCPLLDMIHLSGPMDQVFDRWFQALKLPPIPISKANGYTSWYRHYENITQQKMMEDLDAMSKLRRPVDIFQIDDGYQKMTGDWLDTDLEKFPMGMKYMAHQIHQKGMQAGLWLAPFGCAKRSQIAHKHPDWLIRDAKGKPIECGINWGGFYALDIEKEPVREHLRHVFDVVLKEWGYDMVKLDFLYAAAIQPRAGKSRGQLMCEAMDFLRECVGSKKILGCGVPLMPAFGKVDYCRIGADMALTWKKNLLPNLEVVSTTTAMVNTVFRRQLNGRAFLNDPDVFLLRDEGLKISLAGRQIISVICKAFGSVLFTSDNVAQYDRRQLSLLQYVFDKSDIHILKAEFIRPRILKVVFEEQGTLRRLCFHIDTGELY